MACVFCKIVSKEIPSTAVFEDKDFMVVKDIHPQAPTHLLVIPKTHFPTLVDCEDKNLLGGMLQTVTEVAKKHGFAESGFRTVINTNAGGGQTIFHLHMHILAGKKLTERME